MYKRSDKQPSSMPFCQLVNVGLACITLCLLGCQSESTRRPISGAVTVNGQSVERGSISFFPDQGHAGPAASTAIVDGSYRFSTSNGPTAGPHRVMIGAEAKPEEPAHVIVNLPAQSAGAKLPPEAMAAFTRNGKEPNSAKASQKRWTVAANIPASGTADSNQPIDFALKSEADSEGSPATEAKQ